MRKKTFATLLNIYEEGEFWEFDTHMASRRQLTLSYSLLWMGNWKFDKGTMVAKPYTG